MIAKPLERASEQVRRNQYHQLLELANTLNLAWAGFISGTLLTQVPLKAG